MKVKYFLRRAGRYHQSHRRLLALVILLGLTVGLAGFDQAVPLSIAATPTSVEPVTVGAARLGPTSRQQKINLAIGLKPQDRAALDQFLADLYDTHSPGYKQYLTPAQYTSRFISAATRAALISFLTSQALSVSDNGLGSVVKASGSVAQVEAAFGVHISDYREARTGRIFYSNDVTPTLPPGLASRVESLVGLQNYRQYRSRSIKAPLQPQNSRTSATSRSGGTPVGCTGATSAAARYGSYTPNQFKTAYNFDAFYAAGLTGGGQTLAVYELSDYEDTNVATYQACFGTAVPVSRVAVDGGTTDLINQGEVELDIEIAVGLAPGLSKVLVYEAPNNDTAYIDEYQQIANDNTAQVVSSSWGNCEPYFPTSVLDTENTIYQQMATQGQSLFIASGDYGSEACYPINGSLALAASDGLDSPYATGVGGTRLDLKPDNTIGKEVTWNDYSTGYGASNGGISTYFARPSFQVGPGTTNAYSNGKRQTPDISADASPYTGYTVYSAGEWTAYGGTSAAAPLWAAAAVLTNQYLSQAAMPVLGFANATIYRIFNSAAASVYHDITVGDNCYDPSCGTPNSGTGLYPATTGYDLATGIGTFDAYNFAVNACNPLVVINGADSGAGSLRAALTTANASNAACKIIDASSSAIGSTISLSSGLSVGPGVTIFGPVCGLAGPTLTLQGNGASGDGLTLSGATLSNLGIKGFRGRQLVAPTGRNSLSCVSASKN